MYILATLVGVASVLRIPHGRGTDMGGDTIHAIVGRPRRDEPGASGANVLHRLSRPAAPSSPESAVILFYTCSLRVSK